MSELNFPKNPAVGQEYTFNSLLYMFDGVKWVTKGTGYNPVQNLYEMLASDAGASFVGANGYDNVQAALEDLSANVSSLETVDADLQAQVDTKINADFVSRFDRESLRRSYAEAGYNLVDGSFEAGGTLTAGADVILHELSGKAYSGSGPFPRVVPSGTSPTTPGFADQSGKLFSTFLGAVDSAELVAGIPAKYLALLSKSDDYTLIQPTAMRIDKLTKSLTQNDTSIVITGDSLSFNGFGYPSGLFINGGIYATDNPFGMSSWAHLLRDAIFTSHASFIPVEKCSLETNGTLNWLATNAQFINFGINSKVATVLFSSVSEAAKLYSGFSGNKAIIVSYSPSSDAVLFEVNGVEYDNTSPTGHYQNRGYMIIPVSASEITIGNVRKKSDGTAGELSIYGCGSTGMTVPKLTGKGAWTSGQILAEYSTLVAPYAPDIIYYIIGANDIGSGVSIATFDANVRQFIANARADKPDCEIVLLSTPPTTTYTRAVAKPYIKAMRLIAEDTKSSLIDMWSALEGVPISEYRFDNIHFNAKGDTLVFDIVRRFTMPNYTVESGKFFPSREVYLGAYGTFFYYNSTENWGKTILLTVLCGASPSIVNKYPVNRVPSVSLSYTTVNGKSALVVGLSPLDVITGISALRLSFGVNAKWVELYTINNQHSWTLVGIDGSNNQIDLASSGLYLTVSATLSA